MKFYVTIVLFWLNRFRPKVCRLCCRSVDDFHFFKSGQFMFSSSFFFRIIFQNFFSTSVFFHSLFCCAMCVLHRKCCEAHLCLCVNCYYRILLPWHGLLDKPFSLPIETNYHNFDRSLCLFLFFFRMFILAISNCIAFGF